MLFRLNILTVSAKSLPILKREIPTLLFLFLICTNQTQVLIYKIYLYIILK